MGYWNAAPPDDEDLFSFVCETLNAGGLPTVVIDPRPIEGMICFYRNGLSDPACVEHACLRPDPVTEQEIADAINSVYLSQLITPDQNASSIPLWENAGKFYPSSDAERLIQAHVKSGLAARFQNYDIRQEQASQFGRTDLEIVETQGQATGVSIHHAVLELKVLRAFTKNGRQWSSKAVHWWVRRGIRQAFSYGSNKNTRICMVCCFDMRMKDVGLVWLDEFKSEASKANVWLRRWFMYNQSSAYRDAQFNTIDMD
ncbi:hypothetical protein [Burkholderia gladioli]|uniref:hypothetical protein n=1 Tax=Burkholderia gladioli TaxID=28095 RepID=UPI000FD729F6|nr:hypothetical protein [Burkholderia gladioli]